MEEQPVLDGVGFVTKTRYVLKTIVYFSAYLFRYDSNGENR